MYKRYWCANLYAKMMQHWKDLGWRTLLRLEQVPYFFKKAYKCIYNLQRTSRHKQTQRFWAESVFNKTFGWILQVHCLAFLASHRIQASWDCTWTFQVFIVPFTNASCESLLCWEKHSFPSCSEKTYEGQNTHASQCHSEGTLAKTGL